MSRLVRPLYVVVLAALIAFTATLCWFFSPIEDRRPGLDHRLLEQARKVHDRIVIARCTALQTTCDITMVIQCDTNGLWRCDTSISNAPVCAPERILYRDWFCVNIRADKKWCGIIGRNGKWDYTSGNTIKIQQVTGKEMPREIALHLVGTGANAFVSSDYAISNH